MVGGDGLDGEMDDVTTDSTPWPPNSLGGGRNEAGKICK